MTVAATVCADVPAGEGSPAGAKAKPLSFDEMASVITGWLHLLVDPQDIVELRALKCQTKYYRKPHTYSGFFDFEHLDGMARRAVALSRDIARGVYLTLNPVHRDLLSRRCNRDDVAEAGTLATDANITCRRWLLVDADPVRIADVSSTNEEKAAALKAVEAVRAHLRELGWPEPILADSGNGFHLLYRIELPVDDGGLVERCLRALAGQFDNPAVKIDTTVFNPSRIVKLYGTVSRKGDSTTDRPHRYSQILEIPPERVPVPIELIEALAATAPKPPPPPKRSRSSKRSAKNITNRVQKYLAKLPRAISGQGGHAATFRAACAVVLGFDMSPDDALPLLADWNQTHCQPPWDEHELRHKLEDADKKTDERGYLLNKTRSVNGYHRANGRISSAGKPSEKPVASHLPNEILSSAPEIGNADALADGATDLGSGPGDARPEIDAGDDNLEVVTAQVWDAIGLANEPPFLFRYGGAPGRIEQDDQGEPLIRLVEEHRMRHILARVAKWTKVVGVGDNQAIVDAAPPLGVVRDVLATPDMSLPVLTRIVEAPVFARDGTLQTEPGYHPASRTLYVPTPGFDVPVVSEKPTPDEISEARGLLCDDMLVDFPFTDEAERAHAVALLLLPFARDLIAGAAPLHLFEKPAPGTGATLLVDMLSYPATGRPIPTMTEGRDEDEWRKRLTAKLRNSPQFLLIDNLRRRLDSGAVSAAITSPTWEDRILGQSVTLRIHIRCGWLATGNNPVVSSEMSRRIIRIRLDAKMDRPWLRTEFKHADLRGWVRQNRARLVWAALTLIRAWIVAGRPPGGLKLGMFEDWSEVMGGILDVAGITGFLSNLDEFYDESDAEGAQWRSFVVAWWNEHNTCEVKVADLYGLINDDVVLPLGDGSDQSRKVRLGQMLTQARDRMFDMDVAEGESLKTSRVCIRRGDMKKRAYEWKLEEAGKSGKQKPGESLRDSPKTHPETHPECNANVAQQIGAAELPEGESGESMSNAYAHAGAHAPAHTRARDQAGKTHHTHQTHPHDQSPQHKRPGCQATEVWRHVHGGSFCAICWPPTDPAAVLREPP